MALDILNWRGKLFWIGMCAVVLWILIIMEAVKLKNETRFLDSSYFWILLTVNFLAHFLLWMSGTPYIYPSETVEDEKSGQEVVRTTNQYRWMTWERHPAVHYATGGFGKFFFLLIFLDIFYYGCIMRDQWYEVVRVLIMDATLVVGIFILNSHNRLTTHRGIITILGLTLLVYNVIMIARTFALLTHSIDHSNEKDWKPLIPLDDDNVAKASVTGHPHGAHYKWHMYRGYEQTRLYDMVLYTALLLFFSIFLKLREKILYPDRDVLGWNNKIELRHEDPERARLITKETIVVNSNPMEA